MKPAVGSARGETAWRRGGPSVAALAAPDVLQRVQDWFADTCGFSVEVRDRSGALVTRPSYQDAFSKMVLGSEYGRATSQRELLKALRRSPIRAEVVKVPLFANIVQFAAPIFSLGRFVGVLVLGVRSGAPPDEAELKRLRRALGVPEGVLEKALSDSPPADMADYLRALDNLPSVAKTIGWLCDQGAQLRAQMQRLQSLYEVNRLLASTLDLRKVLDLVARCAVEVSGAKGCSVRLLDPKTRRLNIEAYYNLSRRYLDKGEVILDQSPIDQEALRGEVVQIPDMLNDPRVLYPREAEREGIRSGISIGLIAKGKPVGTLHLYTAQRRHFDESEVQLLRSLADQAAVAIQNAQLYEETLAKRRLERELRVAGAIQAQLLPEKPPALPGYDLAALSLPCSEVGGDFYDFVPTREGRTAIVIADVAGKGVPGALLMASARAAARAYLERTWRPHEVLQRLNVFLSHDTRAGQFVSLFCGVLDAGRKLLAYSNGGHNPPLLIRRRRTIPLDVGGLVLGAEENERYAETAVPLRRGDVVVFYTDGVTEAHDPRGQVFGTERLVSIVRSHYGASAAVLLRTIRNALRRHTHDAEQSDDITLIVLRVL